MTVSAARIRTKTFADEMASLIQTNAASLSLVVVQFGAVEHLAFVSNAADLLPSVWIKPESTPFEDPPLHLGGQFTYDVSDTFRICYAFAASDNTLEISDKASDDVGTIVRALAADSRLTNIATTISPDKVVGSHPLDVLWFSDEDALFLSENIPIRVVTLRWKVDWLARDVT